MVEFFLGLWSTNHLHLWLFSLKIPAKRALRTFPLILSCSFYSPFPIRTFYTVSLLQSICIAINALPFEENRFSNKINRRKKLETQNYYLTMRQIRYSAKKQLHKGEQNVTKWNSAALKKIGSVIRSIEEKSWKTELISYNETSASFCRKTTPRPHRGTECYKMKQLSIQ